MHNSISNYKLHYAEPRKPCTPINRFSFVSDDEPTEKPAIKRNETNVSKLFTTGMGVSSKTYKVGVSKSLIHYGS